jgi:hypothetical protein
VRHTSACRSSKRSVHMQAWRFPMLELTPGPVSDALSGTGDASDAVAGALTAGVGASSSLPLEAGGIAARTSHLSIQLLN